MRKPFQLKLADYHLKVEELVQLADLSLFVFHLAQHSLSSRAAVVSGYSAVLAEHIRNARREPLLRREQEREILEELLRTCETLQPELVSFVSSLKAYTPRRKDEYFLSRPADEFDWIKLIRTRTGPEVVICPESPKNLEIIYPANVLYGIIEELVANTARAVRPAGKVLVQWRIKGIAVERGMHRSDQRVAAEFHGDSDVAEEPPFKREHTEGLRETAARFECQVHDDGGGFALAPRDGFVPLDAILSKNEPVGHGLTMLFQILVKSGGLLLFSRSKVLGGALVHFEFPVLGFCQDSNSQ